jgi:MFS family permease
MGIDRAHRRVIVASSLGTMFEWYDFYLYGSLAAVISKQFFSGVNETTAFIFALLAFAAGFAVRPFGAIIFGRLGDMSGRKRTFLITIVLMGLATALVGVLPSYASIGIAAPIILVALRLVQGLAVGGEYGGAATYVAEHAPPGRRAYYTSWIQITATAGMVLSLIVILGCRWLTGPEFEVWGWRIPFLLSIILLFISVYIRLQLEESPVFRQMRDAGKLSKRPLRESIGQWSNLKLVLLALFGAMAGQAVVGYVSLVYMNLFLTQTLKVDPATSNLLVAGALAAATPFYLLSGRIADRFGRKPQVMVGCLLAALLMFPIFNGLTQYANPAISTAQAAHPIVVTADPAECSLQFDPVGGARFTSSCDIAKTALASSRAPYSNEECIRRFDFARRGVREPQRGLQTAGVQPVDQQRLSIERRSRADELSDGVPAAVRIGRARCHDLWADRGMARGAVPGPHSLYVHVVALSPGQRLVRRFSTEHRIRDDRLHRRYLFGAVVSGHRVRDDRHRRHVLSPGNTRRRSDLNVTSTANPPSRPRRRPGTAADPLYPALVPRKMRRRPAATTAL